MVESRPFKCSNCQSINSMIGILNTWYCPFCIKDQTDSRSILIKKELKKIDDESEAKKNLQIEQENKIKEEKDRIHRENIEDLERIEKEFKNLKHKLLKSKNQIKHIDNIPNGYYLYDYHPTKVFKQNKRINNPLFDDNSRLILDIKNFDVLSIIKAVIELKKIFGGLNLFTICIVPSHNYLNISSGIGKIAKMLCNKEGVDGTDCIKRKMTIPSRRSISGRHYSQCEIKELMGSLIIENEDLIRNKNILLLDDISTTGCSLESGRQLLLENGAKSVFCIVLGKTSYDHNL